jgi:hypothetical protein
MALVSERFQRKVDVRPANECWPWIGCTNDDGYGKVGIEGKTYYAHRLVLEWKLGRPLLPGMESKHSCDNPPCCNPDHLFEDTHKGNMQDAIVKGRLKVPVWTPELQAKHRENTPKGDGHWTRQSPEKVPTGEAQGNSKLTWEIVRDIRARRAAGQMLKEIAPIYDVSLPLVSMIARNLIWIEPGQERQQRRKGKPGPTAKPLPIWTCQRPGCGKQFSRRFHKGSPPTYCSYECSNTANYGNLGVYALGKPKT